MGRALSTTVRIPSILVVLLALEALAFCAKRCHALAIGFGESSEPSRNQELQRRLDSLIQEAKLVADHLGIDTECNRYYRASLITKPSSPAKNKERSVNFGALRLQDYCMQNDEKCRPNGVCMDGKCSCAAAFVGKYCGHSALLAVPPSRPDRLLHLGWYGNKVTSLGDSSARICDYAAECEIKLYREFSSVNDSIYDSCLISVPQEVHDDADNTEQYEYSRRVWLRLDALHRDQKISHRLLIVDREDVRHDKEKSTTIGGVFSDHINGSIILIRQDTVENSEAINRRPFIPPNSWIWDLPPQRVLLSDRKFEEHVSEISELAGTREKPSHALFSVIFSMNICREVTLNIDQDSFLIPTLKCQMDRTECVSNTAERMLLQAMSSSNLIQLSSQKWSW